MKTKTLLASLAVASLVVAQPASAATRSADSLPQGATQAAAGVERVGSISAPSEQLTGTPIFLIILLFGSLAAFIALVSSGNKSPG